MDAPLVSILTPSYQQGRFLRDCIDSVLNQTYPRLEHIVCDGGSTDESLDVLRSTPTVRWVSEPDDGQANAVNKALDRSTGEIIGWLNSDDAYFDPSAVEAAVAVFLEQPHVDVVYGHAALVGADGELLQLMWSPSFHPRLFRHANFIIQPSTFVRRTALATSMLDESFDFAMDRELWLRLWSRGHAIRRLDRIVAIDRHHDARKVYTQQAVGDRENERLRESYLLPAADLRSMAVQRSFRVVARVLGVRLLPLAYRPAAFGAHVARPVTLLRRQLFTLRRFMPLLAGNIRRQ